MKKSTFGSKLKSIMKIKTEGEDEPPPGATSAEAAEPTEVCSFQPAASSLDIMVQARENLTRFGRYLEDDPFDSFSKYRIVSQCMVHAFGQFADRTADLQDQLEKAAAAATDFDEPLAENQNEQTLLTAELAKINEDNRIRSENLAKLKEEITELEAEILEQKKLEAALDQMRQREADLKRQLEGHFETIAKESAAVSDLEAQLAQIREQADKSDAELNEELQKSEEVIKDLTAKARKAEGEEKVSQAKQKPVPPSPPPPASPVPAPVDEPSAFMIKDKVKISDRESDSLINMIKAIRKENAELTTDRDSVMVDIDCLMQENIGLKLLIQQIAGDS
jgi:uncharacterized phage infection (PIP) family protein YhgE